MVDRRETAEHFRARLRSVIDSSGLSRSAFAAAIGTDRSTLSQLLLDDATRLPRAETIVAIAQTSKMSVDWLLGLSQEGQFRTDVLEVPVTVEPGASSPVDERITRWHAEAAGYKIRYVPSGLPDLLKTEAVIRYEYGERVQSPAEYKIERAQMRLAYGRRPETDIEICADFQRLESFAAGQGIWQALPLNHRLAQLERMRRLLDELYPTVRLFLYDAHRCFSAPITIFGPQRAAIYVGSMFLAFTGTEHIRALTGHFDNLIRAATMQPPEVIDYIERLARTIRPRTLAVGS